MIRVRYWVTGRERVGSPERVLASGDDLRKIHRLGIDKMVGGYEDVTIRDWRTETRWVPVPWSPHLDDAEDGVGDDQ